MKKIKKDKEKAIAELQREITRENERLLELAKQGSNYFEIAALKQKLSKLKIELLKLL